VYGMIKIQEKS